jgi:hypothetical protein
MGNIAFLVAFLALPVLSYLWVRSITWLVIWIFASAAVVGSFVDFTIRNGQHWDLPSLQFALLVSLLIVAVAALVSRRLRPGAGVRSQAIAIGAPVVVALIFIIISRLLAVGHAGPWSAVGYFVQRISAEDNAKWLDFSGQLLSGDPVNQAVPLGGPLQLAVIFAVTVFAVISQIAFSGVNQVYVASNSILFLQLGLAVISPIMLAPFIEAKLKNPNRTRLKFPAPVIWAAAVVIMTASIAVSGLGHLTFQYAFIVAGLWISVFLVGSNVPHARVLTSVAAAVLLITWFPLILISIVIYAGLTVYLIRALMRNTGNRRALVIPIAATLITLVFVWEATVNTLTYILDLDSVSASGATQTFGGSLGASAHAVIDTLMPANQLLNASGGTELASPILSILALLTAVLALLNVNRRLRSHAATALAFAPLALIAVYAFALGTLGTWYSGSGPNYGAQKMTFFAVILTIVVCTPFALMEINRNKPALTPARIGAAVGILFLISIDGLLPRAMTYTSPEQWPSIELNRNYWWPAEVRNTADQSIASNPVGCMYLEPGDALPTVLKDGQRMYACTRILAGLSGMDSTAQGLVDYQRREWLTNEAAWLNEYPNLQLLPPEVRAKQLILISGNNDVLGLESIDRLMQRYKPEWAQ